MTSFIFQVKAIFMVTVTKTIFNCNYLVENKLIFNNSVKKLSKLAKINHVERVTYLIDDASNNAIDFRA